MNLITTKAAAKYDFLFNKPASEAPEKNITMGEKKTDFQLRLIPCLKI